MRRKFINYILAALVAVWGLMGMTPESGQAKAVTDLGFVVDRSGSLTSAECQLAMQGLANAINNNIPGTGDYRIGVVTFSSGTPTTLVPATVVTAANKAGIVNTINTNGGSGFGTGGSTNYETALQALNTTFGTLNSDALVNMTTDGAPNSGNTGSAYLQGLMTGAGWSGLSFEAVGASASGITKMTEIAYANSGLPGDPATVVLGSGDPIPDARKQSFVVSVASFNDYSNVIDQKLAAATIPLPAGLPLLLGGLAVLGGLGASRRRRAAA